MPLWLLAVAIPLSFAAFYLATVIFFRAANPGLGLKRLLTVFLICVVTVGCVELAELPDAVSDKIDAVFGSAWDYVQWVAIFPCTIALMLSLYLGVVTLLLWSSKILAKVVSFVMWGVIGNKEGAVAGLFAFVTLALGIVKALLS